MSYNMNDFFSGLDKLSNKPHYTEEEIAAAKKRQKKRGGTILENLEAIRSGSGGETPLAAMEASLQAMQENAAQAEAANSAIQNAVSHTADEISASIRSLNASIAQDFDLAGANATASGGQAGVSAAQANGTSAPQAGTSAPRAGAAPALTDNGQILGAFSGISDVLREKVFGQEDFIKKLLIAFKRPYVSERDHNDALNSIYITGPACTGKHYALSALAQELCRRGITGSPLVYTVDLSLYPNASEEKLFLQDLYAALQSDCAIIAFENIDGCHISILTHLSALVTTGECKLSERYISQNGQLINVANAFAGNTIGSFEAKGKYLVFLSDKPVDKLAGVMGAPFVNALGDICATISLDEESLKKISAEREKQLVEKCQKQLSFDITVEDSFREYILSQTSRGRALGGILDAYGDTARALTELRLERDDLPSSLTLKCVDGNAVIAAGGTPGGDKGETLGENTSGETGEIIPLSSLLPAGYQGELDNIKAEMDAIVGLKEVKEYIYNLEEYFGVQKRRREAGLKAGEVNKHMIFTGNPGTGKTTIARIVSKYLKAIGVLSGGQLVEVSRADLVGRYVGHTAPLVNQVIKSAIGGVLFIDEAYSLYRGKDDSFGLEAIDTLVKGIEDNRDDLIVILAGYSKEMEDFLEANSGLKSRFPNIIDFPDYTGEELLAIGMLTARSKGYVIDEAAEQPLLDYFNHVQATRAKDAGNGRLVRNKLEEAILNQSRRLVAEQDADMSLLTEMDFDLSD